MIRMKHQLRFLALAAALGAPLAGLPATAAAAASNAAGASMSASAAPDATSEAAPVVALDQALIATMKAGSAGDSFKARFDALQPVINSSFDLPLVEQNSVGFLWSTLPAAQQQALGTLFDEFTVASYVSEFSSYHGEQFQLLPTQKSLGSAKIVETQLVPGGSRSPTELDYVVANGPSGWQITDVLLNGTISQVAVHASDFSGLVSAGNASKLITALKSKIASLSHGSIGA
jgi:phospholipid transport system substrate-binding protein